MGHSTIRLQGKLRGGGKKLRWKRENNENNFSKKNKKKKKATKINCKTVY